MDAQEIARYYPLPDAEYLRGELETLQNDFRAFQESIADGPPCICIDNPDPPKEPVDKDPELNKGDTSAKGLRAALDRLTRRATAMRAAQDEGAACVCPGKAGAETKTGTETVTETGTGTGTGIRTAVVETPKGGPGTPRQSFGGPGVFESPFLPPGPFDGFTFAGIGLGTGTGTRTAVVETQEGGPGTPRQSSGRPEDFKSPFLAPGPYAGFTFAGLSLGTGTGTRTEVVQTQEGGPTTPRETGTRIRTEVVQTGEGGPETPIQSFGGPGVLESPFLEPGPFDRLNFANLGLR